MKRRMEKTKLALDENRILMLGAQVLLGLEFRAVFESAFDQLSRLSQYLTLVSLGLLLIAVGVLLIPSPFHQVVERGETTEEFSRLFRSVLMMALLPFAAGIAVDGYVAAERVWGPRAALAAGGIVGLMATWFWYGLEITARGRRSRHARERGMIELPRHNDPPEPTSVDDKVDLALTETRIVLPGAQALLGFQFIAILTTGFDQLPTPSKYVHLASLACVALATILLLTPPAYHRIVEEGENSEEFHGFVSRMLLTAMCPLALGLATAFYVVAQKVLHSTDAGIILAAIAYVFLNSLWFGYVLFRRQRRATILGADGQVLAR